MNPKIPCTLVVDHSVTAYRVSYRGADRDNERIEAEHNRERFTFLKWSASSFQNVSIVPPGHGICHQLNIEYLCDVAMEGTSADGVREAYFDTLVGTDSHTTTANGMGVLGWGVGGIEAEAAALGQPITMMVPAVIGLKLTGAPRPGVCAMDVALSFAEFLRARGVVGSIVECTGPGVAALTPTQRATIANMSPEYGCTATFFPADEATLAQLDAFARTPHERSLARAYLEAQGMLGQGEDTVYAEVLEFDLASVEPSLAGPARPHARLGLSELRGRFRAGLAAHGRSGEARFDISIDGEDATVGDGAIAIAAITSCTTATDLDMMVAAGIVAERAVRLGCRPRPWVKKVFAPGSSNTYSFLAPAYIEPLEQLGFAVCGYGCMSCIGNSGPVFEPLHAIADSCELVSVLSGNRNFEGRISPDVSQNYLCSPSLVVALSLAGTVDIDLAHDPLCEGAAGPVYLSDLMPEAGEVERMRAHLMASVGYAPAAGLFEGKEDWCALDPARGETFSWDPASTYVRRPGYFDGAAALGEGAVWSCTGARCLALLGDFITTDHISPAGTIAPDSPAARYLRAHGVADGDFNTYGARRGNHEVMMRGTFANVKLANLLAAGRKGGWTRDFLSGDVRPLYDASEHYAQERVPLVVVAGKMYGSGSSRDWAAKGPALLGIRAAFAESFERIHRSNLIGMGILPLQFAEGESAESLGLDGSERYTVAPIDFSAGLPAPREVAVTAERADGSTATFKATVRVDTPTEGRYYENGGILPYVLRSLL